MSSESGNITGRSAGIDRSRIRRAVVVMIAAVVVVGALGYVVLNTLQATQTHTTSTCVPTTSPSCHPPPSIPDDVLLSVPLGIREGAFLDSDQGQAVSAYAYVLGGEPMLQWQINWGDGSVYSGSSPSATHVYSELGSYILSAQALDDASTWQNGYASLVPLNVTPSPFAPESGAYPSLATTLSNGSAPGQQFGWLEGSGMVRVSARYTSPPTYPGYTAGTPSLVSTGGNPSDYVQNATGVSSSYWFSTPGIYEITMIGPVIGPEGTSYQNFTWTVVVSPLGVQPGLESVPPPSVRSPHPGHLVYEEVAPGGATTEDPSATYDTISAEPVWNVYQTLVAYNGSSTASFLPELSTCVPGSAGADSCQAIYGNPLIVYNGTSPQYWTFPIDKVARFYDPFTGASWPVYPSDMMFSMARTCSFVDLPGVAVQPGWIQCQSLLNIGNAKWDSAIHAPYNNTPSNILGSMLINDSKYCPANVMAASNGCITYDAWGGGAAWSFFLELIADPMGGAAEPCGWFTYQGATVPNFAGTLSSAKGDGPCYLPDSSAGNEMTTTNSTAWKTFLSSLTPTAWDSYQLLSMNAPAINPTVRWNMVGSGPYYLATMPFTQSVGYTLDQNPAYQAPTGCKGQPNCEPLPGPSNYAANVTVVYQPTDTVGIEQYKAGQTDFATILPGETPELLSLIQEGKIGAFMVPTLNVFFLSFTEEFNVTEAKSIDPDELNVPGDFFNYVGLREFLVNAFPYSTVENTIFTTDGIQYGFNYGGAIPQYMGNYYPTNISWPSGDPVTNPSVNGSAAWWWAEATTSGSPYYDPELTACTTSSPCRFPIIGQEGATTVDQLLQDYMPYISSISGGRLAPNTFDFQGQLVVYSLSALPGQSAMPFYNEGWAPDYPDPTDYVVPMYSPNASFTLTDAVQQGLSRFTCVGSSFVGPTASYSLAGLLFWAHQSGIPQACQGNAYGAMEYGMNQAAGMPIGPTRVLFYNLVEHIANNLALYVYYDQQDSPVTYAPWIDPTTMNTNPVIGGTGDNTWYLYGGNGVTA